jgi:hypothetical protein
MQLPMETWSVLEPAGKILKIDNFLDRVWERKNNLLREVSQFYQVVNALRVKVVQNPNISIFGSLPTLPHIYSWDASTVKAFKGELLHAIKYTDYEQVFNIKNNLMQNAYRIFFQREPNLLNINELVISLCLESVNLSRIMGRTDKLSVQDIPQPFFGIINYDYPVASIWYDIISVYCRIIKDETLREILKSVPQNPQSMEFFDDVYPAMSRAMEIKEIDIAKYQTVISEYLAKIVLSENALNIEGYWETHTRLQKFIISWVVLTSKLMGSYQEGDKFSDLLNRLAEGGSSYFKFARALR